MIRPGSGNPDFGIQEIFPCDNRSPGLWAMVYGYRFQSLRAHLWSHDASKIATLHAKNREKLPHGIMERLHNPPLVAE